MDKQKPWRGQSKDIDRESLEPLSTELYSSGGVKDSVAELPSLGYNAHSPKLHRPTPVPSAGRASSTSVRSEAPSMHSINDDEADEAAPANGLENGHTALREPEDHNMDEALLSAESASPLEDGQHQTHPPRHVRFHSRDMNGGGAVPSLDLSRPSGGEQSLASPEHMSNREAKIVATNHIRAQESDLEAVVRFLRTTPGLSYQVIGDMVGEHCERCCQLLTLFTDSFDFSGLPFETALRGFLEAFRLPGEAQKINRILTAFASQYWRQCGRNSPFRNEDAVFVLSYAVVMLNTDLHNPKVKAGTKMTMAEFVRNCRGINAEQDYNALLLEELYVNIQQQSLRVPPDFAAAASTSDNSRLRKLGWKSSKQKSRSRCCGLF